MHVNSDIRFPSVFFSREWRGANGRTRPFPKGHSVSQRPFRFPRSFVSWLGGNATGIDRDRDRNEKSNRGIVTDPITGNRRGVTWPRGHVTARLREPRNWKWELEKKFHTISHPILFSLSDGKNRRKKNIYFFIYMYININIKIDCRDSNKMEFLFSIFSSRDKSLFRCTKLEKKAIDRWTDGN